MKIEIIGRGPLTPAQLDEILFGTSTINRKNPLEEAMDRLINDVKRGDEKKYKAPICFDIQSITANHKKNAFTVVWGDGSHTMIHLQPGDVWDDEKALAMCFVKHMMGDTGSFNDIFTEEMPAKIKHIDKEVAPEEEKVAKMAKMVEAIKQLGDAAEKSTEACEQMTMSFEETSHSQYGVYLRTNTVIIPAGHYETKGAAIKRVKALAKELLGVEPSYYRTWLDKDGILVIDFGSHTQWLSITGGMTPEDFIKR